MTRYLKGDAKEIEKWKVYLQFVCDFEEIKISN